MWPFTRDFRVRSIPRGELQRRIAAVDRWFGLCANRIRTEELRPSLSEFPRASELLRAVESLCRRRQLLLDQAAEAAEAPLAGRLILCEYNGSICSGESELVSGGFFDESDRPPWDLWVHAASARYRQGVEAEAIVLAWVPEPLQATAQAGIDANPYDCIYWL